jgi:hypothetical protein
VPERGAPVFVGKAGARGLDPARRFRFSCFAMIQGARSRPFWLEVVNSGGGLLRRARVLSLTIDAAALKAAARRAVRLEDFGPDDFEQPLDLLARSCESEARLNFIGRCLMRSYLTRLLEHRLLLERDRRRHPEIAEQQIRAPIFISGLPRTGSTLLFELMGRNPALRAPRTWEVMFPSPPPRRENFDRDPRLPATRRQLNWLDRMAPEFQRIHAVGPARPQECIAITAHAFRSIEFYTMCNVATYQAWLNTADLGPAYECHYRLLQHFQAFGPRGRWVLKAPAHVFNLEALFRRYPDAQVVHLHRDPVEVLGSLLSLGAHLRGVFSDQVDRERLGETWCGLWAMGLKRMWDFRRQHPELRDRFHDVLYRDLVRDPLAAVEALHRRLDAPFSAAARERVAAHLAANPKGKHGVHRYRLEDYGLTPDLVRRQFAGLGFPPGTASETASAGA